MYSHVVPLNPLRNVNPESLAKLYRPKEEPVSEAKENIEKNPNTSIQIKIRKPREHSKHHKVVSLSDSEVIQESGFVDPDDFFNEIEDNEGEEPYKKRKMQKEHEVIDAEKASMMIIDELDINLLEKSNVSNCLILNEFDPEFNFSGKEKDQNLNQNFSKKTYFNFSSKSEPSNLNYNSPESVFEFSDKQSISNDASSITQIETHTISIVSTKLTTKIQRKSSSKGGPTQNQLRLQECLKEIKETDLQRLEPGIYLNDNIINFYMKVVQYGFLSESRRRQCHFFNTYFMPCMRQSFAETGNDLSKFGSVYEKMEKWTKKINIFEKDFVFIPLHEDQHWSLVILCYPNRLLSQEGQMPYVIFVNSLCRTNTIYASILFEYLSRELQAKKPNEFQLFKARTTNSGVTSLMYYQHMVPKQSNMTDCGLYLLQYLEMFAEDEKYVVNNKENLNKIKWFPRSLILEKRHSIKKIIDDLMSSRFETFNQYITKRNKVIKAARKNPEDYNSFNKIAFEEAFARAYSNMEVPSDEKVCLMLEFYYTESLDLRR